MRPRIWGALALGALVLVLATPVAAESGPRLTLPTKASKEDLEPARTYADPYVLVDPDNPLVVLAATVEMRSRNCRLFRSADGGASWKLLDATPSLPSFPYCHHTRGATTMTPMAWGRNGTVYFARTGWDTQDIGPPGTFPGTWGNMSVLLGRSNDLGNTWETAIVRNARGKQGPETEVNIPVSSVAVDTTHGRDDISTSPGRAAAISPVRRSRTRRWWRCRPTAAGRSESPLSPSGATSSRSWAACRPAGASRRSPWPTTAPSTCCGSARSTTSTCCCYPRRPIGAAPSPPRRSATPAR